jgi:hypothetical protein
MVCCLPFVLLCLQVADTTFHFGITGLKCKQWEVKICYFIMTCMCATAQLARCWCLTTQFGVHLQVNSCDIHHAQVFVSPS